MSTSKHIDKICIAVVAITLVITILFMNGTSLGLVAAEKAMGYESRLFDTGMVHTLDIVMNDWDSFITNCESEEYSACTVVIDGEAFKNVGLRAKGNTSLSSVSSMGSQRYSFKIEFDQYEKGKSYYGLDKLCLNNLIQDNTMMKDYLAYQLMDDFGVDAPLSSYVYITVNGEDWGLYLAVEAIEDSFLSRNYGSDIGDLYKPDTLNFGAGRGNGKDFNMDDLTEELEGTETESSESSESSENNGTAGFPTPGATSGSDSSQSGFGGGNFPQGGFNGGDIPQGGFNGGEIPQGGFNGGEIPQGGFNGGEIPQGGFDFNGQTPPTGGDFNFDGGSISSDGSFDISSIAGGANFGNFFGGMGMGSDDVKLKYIDDDPDSYANIFDSAKTVVNSADKTRLINSLKNLSEYTDLEEVLDIDEVLRYFVVHIFLCNGDSYTGSMIHNYYLYEEDGELSMIPWDYNLAYGTFMGGNASSSVNASIDNPLSGSSVDDRPMVGWIFSDEEYTEAYHALYGEFIEEWFTSGKLEAMIQETAEMIRPYVEKDPTKFCTSEEFETGVEVISEFMSLRAEAVSRQLSGDNTAVETNGLNLSDMGSMGGSNGFGGNRGSSDKSDNEGDSNRPDSFGGMKDGEMPEGISFPFGNMGDSLPERGSREDSSADTPSSAQTAPSSDASSDSTPDNVSDTSSDTVPDTGVSSRPDKSFSSQNFDFSKINGSPTSLPGFSSGTMSQTSSWTYVGISFAVMLLGIVIARKKKY